VIGRDAALINAEGPPATGDPSAIQRPQEAKMITPHNARRDRAGFALRQDLRLARTHIDRGPGRHWEQLASGGWGPICEAHDATGIPETTLRNWAARGKLGELRYPDPPYQRKVNFQQCADLWAAHCAKQAAKNVAKMAVPAGPRCPGDGYFADGKFVPLAHDDPERAAKFAKFMRGGEKEWNVYIGWGSDADKGRRAGDEGTEIPDRRPRLLVWTPEQRRILTAPADLPAPTTEAQREAQLQAMVAAHNLRTELNAETARLEDKERLRLSGCDRSAEGARKAEADRKASERVGPAFPPTTRPLTADELADIECEYAIHDRQRPDRVVVRRVGRGREQIAKAKAKAAARWAEDVAAHAAKMALTEEAEPTKRLKNPDDVEMVLGTDVDDLRIDDAAGYREAAEALHAEAEAEGYGGWEGSDKGERACHPEISDAAEPTITVKAEPTHRATVRCQGPLHRGECSWACRRSIKRKCTCACGGANHGIADPDLDRRKPRGTTDLTGGRPQKLPTMPKRRAKTRRKTTQARRAA
jgi:hypothetical protein